MAYLKLILTILGLLNLSGINAWQMSASKVTTPKVVRKIAEFHLNETNSNKFMTMLVLNNHLLIGARNVIYNLSLSDLNVNRYLAWPCLEEHASICMLKGVVEKECHNYIRLVTYTEPNGLMVCGTNAYKPMCRNYTITDNDYLIADQWHGQGVVPYNPNHNSTWVYVDGEVYSATASDFSGSDPLIYRQNVRTEQFYDNLLNEPNFISSMHADNYVYFFFRELAMEPIDKMIFSRVARVCKFDKGGPHRYRNRWMTFFKSRLNCSIPGEIPFYFNEIQSTTGIIDGIYSGNQARLIYATFTTPVNSILGSAVCAFNLADIIKTFEGEFKGSASDKVPEPHPGTCFKNHTNNLSDRTLDFINTHPLMDESVPAYFGEPILVKTSQYRFTKIAVDPQVKTIDGKAFDVLYIGTDNGVVIKAINAYSASSTQGVSTFIVEEWKVFEENAVNNLQVTPDGHLIASSEYSIKSLKLFHCKKNKNCNSCVALRDPYCAWDKTKNICTRARNPSDWTEGNFHQNVLTGEHSACSKNNYTLTIGSY